MPLRGETIGRRSLKMLKIKMDLAVLKVKRRRIKRSPGRSQSCKGMMLEECLMPGRISQRRESPQKMIIQKKIIRRERMNLEETFLTKINPRSEKVDVVGRALEAEEKGGDLNGDPHHL